jgi:malonyl-CoA decarboxylase
MSKAFFRELLSAIGARTRDWRAQSFIAKKFIARDQTLDELCDDLVSRRGEASGAAIALEILNQYSRLDAFGQLSFFEMLFRHFGIDRKKLQDVISLWQNGDANDSDLHFATEPRRQELFRRLNRAPGGTNALVQMRANLLENLSSQTHLDVVDRDFTHLFTSWFNRGFLVLKPIDWTSPVNVLERIIQYEAVHAIQSWDDLRNRLKPPDRRCFSFFHPQLGDEPLVFVEVALTTTIPDAIAPLLQDVRAPIAANDANTAVFYSISNTQKGLAGVSFGNFLIKQVVDDLQKELPHLETFVTLSPMPGFAKWLNGERAKPDSEWLDQRARRALERLDDANWPNDPALRAVVQRALMPIAFSYIVQARTPTGRPIDPVARFHLGNGARLERLNFLGDLSPNGLEQSYGVMANYCYALHEIERNHEAFAERGMVVTGPQVLRGLQENSKPLVTAQ